MEKASQDHIRWLPEITEGERNHELLLFVKNLQELGVDPFPYIVPIIPRSLPKEIIKGEHCGLADLLKLIPGLHKRGPLKEPGLALSGTINHLWLYKIQNLPPRR